MKLKLKNILISLVIGTTFFCQITSVFGFEINYNLKMKVDNTYFAPTDNIGRELRPISHEGTTYLPMRSFAEAVGARVSSLGGKVTITSQGEPNFTENTAPYVKRTIPINAEFKEDTPVYVDEKLVDCEIIWYQNTMYLPIRVLSDMLGINIEYNSELELILIGDSYIEESDYEVLSYTITDEEITNKIADLRIKFPHNKYWNTVGHNYEDSFEDTSDIVTSQPCTHIIGDVHIPGMPPWGEHCNSYSIGFESGTQCHGFALKINDEIFGSDAPVIKHTSYEKAKVGDIIRINNSHSVVIIEKHPDYVKVVEANYGGPCKIQWDRTIYKSSLTNAEYITRY